MTAQQPPPESDPQPRPCPICSADNAPSATRCGACNFHLVDGPRPTRRQLNNVVLFGAGLWVVALVSVLFTR